LGAATVALGLLPDRSLEPGSASYQRLVLAVYSLAGLMVAVSALRRLPLLAYAASATAMAAALMQIAAAGPANIHAYTVPVALYLLTLSYANRHTPAVHNPLAGAGAGLLLVPPFVESLGPDGFRWALATGGAALLLVFVGLGLQHRSYLAGGIVGLTAIVLREMVDVANALPTWATLALVGSILLLSGTGWLAARSEITLGAHRLQDRWSHYH
jgi:hypothetical protein